MLLDLFLFYLHVVRKMLLYSSDVCFVSLLLPTSSVSPLKTLFQTKTNNTHTHTHTQKNQGLKFLQKCMNTTNGIQNHYKLTCLKKRLNTTNPNPRNTLRIRIKSNPCASSIPSRLHFHSSSYQVYLLLDLNLYLIYCQC